MAQLVQNRTDGLPRAANLQGNLQDKLILSPVVFFTHQFLCQGPYLFFLLGRQQCKLPGLMNKLTVIFCK